MEHQYHRELKSTITHFLRLNGYNSRQEVVLPNNKIADIVAMDGNQKILIVEVKTSLRKCSLYDIMDKYSCYCDGLYVAGDREDIEYKALETQLLDWTPHTSRIGFIGVTQGKCSIFRQAIPRMTNAEDRHYIYELLK